MRKLYLSMIFAASAVVSSVRAELLIVKKEGDTFASLSEQDIAQNGNRLQEVKLKYQWPMVISSDLTEQEQNELLSAGVPYAEEKFIEKKVQEISPDYGVVFIPTILYELFAIVHLFQTKEKKNPFQNAVITYLTDEQERKIKLTELLKQEGTPISIRQQINAVYKKANALFEVGNAYLYINNEFVSTLFNQYPELKERGDTLALSQAIKEKAHDFALFLLNELLNLYNPNYPKKLLLDMVLGVGNRDLVHKFVGKIGNQEKLLVKSIVDLEYEARELNKALLFRGTSFVESQVGIGQQPEMQELVGTTIFGKPSLPSYVKKKLRSYSISYGNYLLAGILRDETATAYYYLTERVRKKTGYALLIDKRAYLQHQINNLFFITPLTSLVSLIQSGEFFHPRTKAAALVKTDKPLSIDGLFDQIVDPTGVIAIRRNPLWHAELFATFLSNPDNIRIIKNGLIMREEQDIVKKMLSSQKKAANFYKLARISLPRLAEMLRNWKEKKGIPSEPLTPEEREIDVDPYLDIEYFREVKKKLKASLDADDAETKMKELQEFVVTFVSKGFALKTATEVANRAVNDPDSRIRAIALSLFVILIEKGEALVEATKALKQVADDPDALVQEAVYYLRKALQE